jgi:hypothetical protein
VRGFAVDIQRSVEEARQRFATSLVGEWSTAVGTWRMAKDQIWEIRPDSTGKFTDTGPLGYSREETHFEWRQPAERVFEIRLLRYVSLLSGGELELGEDEREWRTIRYDFVPVTTDLEVVIGLVDVAQAGSRYEGFLDSGAPLVYRGPIPCGSNA